MSTHTEINQREYNAAIVLAAGRGTRMQSAVAKQFLDLGGKPVLCYSLDVFEACEAIDEVVLVTADEDLAFCRKEIVEKYGYSKVSKIVAGGRERYHSVFNGLCALKDRAATECPGNVFIQDGARPFLEEGILMRLLNGLNECGACITAVPAKDTVKIADENGFVLSTPNRDSVWNMQTPQAFHFSLIFEAYSELMENEDQVRADGIAITDDAMVAEYYTEERIRLIRGSYENMKITTPEDMILAEEILKRRGSNEKKGC